VCRPECTTRCSKSVMIMAAMALFKCVSGRGSVFGAAIKSRKVTAFHCSTPD